MFDDTTDPRIDLLRPYFIAAVRRGDSVDDLVVDALHKLDEWSRARTMQAWHRLDHLRVGEDAAKDRRVGRILDR